MSCQPEADSCHGQVTAVSQTSPRLGVPGPVRAIVGRAEGQRLVASVDAVECFHCTAHLPAGTAPPRAVGLQYTTPPQEHISTVSEPTTGTAQSPRQ